MNQPLTAISNYARIIERHFNHSNGGDDRQSASEAATKVVRQVERMDAVVKGFREPIKRGKAKIEPVPIKEVIREAIDLVEPLLLHKEIDVVVAVDRPIRRIMADKLQLEQVLINLISNAAEAMDRNDYGNKQLTYGTWGTRSLYWTTDPASRPDSMRKGARFLLHRNQMA